MNKGSRAKTWWLIALIAVLLAALGYYLYTGKTRKPAEEKPPERVAPATPDREGKPQEAGPEARGTIEVGPQPKVPPGESVTEQGPKAEDICSSLETQVVEFLQYLEGKDYVRHLALETDVESRFKNILRQAAVHPPVPAGEGVDPKIILHNIYHLFRILSRKDLRLIKEVVSHEEMSLEPALDFFYRWITSGDSCPDPENLRPSLEVLYHYAGFFLNTTGGRAYLFRRSTELRLLISYYCVLTLHKADKEGKNSYGIDPFPHIRPLRNEIAHYPDFQFQEEYLERLGWIERYYMERR